MFVIKYNIWKLYHFIQQSSKGNGYITEGSLLMFFYELSVVVTEILVHAFYRRKLEYYVKEH